MVASLALAPAVSLAVDPAAAPPTVPLGCTGSATLGTFQLAVRPFSQGSPLPLKSVAEIPAGARLVWTPMHLKLPVSDSAEVTAVVVPAGDGSLIVLEPRKANVPTEWQLLRRPVVIALVYGPQGLSEGKVQSLVSRNQDLLRQLADYADQSSQVESLVQELADAEQSRGGADNALKGMSAGYGVSAQKLSSTASSDQQAALLLKALIPASNNYDPLATPSNQVQQSGGLAASVAGLFFGNPVALAAGGAALFANLKTVLFPNTEFRSAFAQAADKGGLALCTKNQAPKSKTRTAYLWAYRVPEIARPVPSLGAAQRLPLGAKSTIALKFTKGSAKELEMARDWKLLPADGGKAVAVAVKTAAASSVDIDLSDAKAAAGDYHLAATWDWDSLPVAGTVHLQPYGDFTHIVLAPGGHDKLVEGHGSVAVELTGADFEFLESVVMESSARDAKPAEVAFTLPLGKRAGVQNGVIIHIDTSKQGLYHLSLMQSDGVAHKVPVAVLPPNPKFSNLPIRLNVGETRESILLSGSGLDRVEAILSDAGEIAGGPDSGNWSGEIHLKAGLKSGQTFPLRLKIMGLDDSLTVPGALEIVGPRPKVRSLQRSLVGAMGIEIGADELPAGMAAGLVLTVDRLRDSTRPKLELNCADGELRQALTLAPGGPASGASLTSAGPGVLYLSLDPGVVGYPGCHMSATVIMDPEGRSDPFVLGRVIRLPRLDKFTLTSEKVGDAGYAGILEGHDLDVIEKVGWDAANGLPVDEIPAPLPPLPNDPLRQTLRLILPWPAPGPHAPLYIWLRGESQGRKTSVTY